MAKKKSKSSLWITLSIIGVLAITAIIIAITSKGDDTQEVFTAKVERRTIEQVVAATGKIQPEIQVKVSSETSGEIVFLGVQEGDTVKKGQILVKIKPDIIQTQLEQSKAALDASAKEIDIRKTDLDRIKKELGRQKELLKKGFVSQQEFDLTEATYNTAISSYEATLLRVKQAKASLNQIERDFDRTAIYAPMDGVVTRLNVELGEKVVGTGMMAGTELLVVSDLTVMNAEVDVDENDIILIHRGNTCKVEIDAFPNKLFQGKVIEIGHSANAAGLGTQDQVTNFKVKIRLFDIETRMRPGMSCNADIVTEKRPNVLVVPLQSVTVRDLKGVDTTPDLEKDEMGSSDESVNENKTVKDPPQVVFLYENGKARKQSVKTGISNQGYIEIIDGLKEGIEVISGPFSAVSRDLNDNDKVKVNNKFKMFKSKK